MKSMSLLKILTDSTKLLPCQYQSSDTEVILVSTLWKKNCYGICMVIYNKVIWLQKVCKYQTIITGNNLLSKSKITIAYVKNCILRQVWPFYNNVLALKLFTIVSNQYFEHYKSVKLSMLRVKIPIPKKKKKKKRERETKKAIQNKHYPINPKKKRKGGGERPLNINKTDMDFIKITSHQPTMLSIPDQQA